MQKNGVRCENLEQLTFASDTFDIFIRQDVFNPDMAAREIMRALRPGGVHLFTAPKDQRVRKSYPRARLTENGIGHLLEEQYHGNPVGDGR